MHRRLVVTVNGDLVPRLGEEKGGAQSGRSVADDGDAGHG